MKISLYFPCLTGNWSRRRVRARLPTPPRRIDTLSRWPGRLYGRWVHFYPDLNSGRFEPRRSPSGIKVGSRSDAGLDRILTPATVNGSMQRRGIGVETGDARLLCPTVGSRFGRPRHWSAGDTSHKAHGPAPLRPRPPLIPMRSGNAPAHSMAMRQTLRITLETSS